jgi:RNA polymerase sigma-70 factor (ECF subfamily)
LSAVSLDAPVAGTDEPMDPAGETDPEARHVDRDAIDRALAELPVDQREAVLLRDVEGFDYREIAEQLGVPLGTVESRIFRGRQRLRELLR